MFRAMALSYGARLVFGSSAGTTLASVPYVIEPNPRLLPMVDGPTSNTIAIRGLADAAESLGLLLELMAELSRRQGGDSGLCPPHGELQPGNPAPILTVAEVAAMLRMNTKSVYAAIAAGELPGKKVGRRTFVPRAALLDWLRSNERVPPSRGRRV
ncbi:MAG TPA: helix-turn-helix domain-containing protein [Myxococcota bacterium]|nr:helix-turn-helix domain-containing protein [Myxococcota bacterium]HRY96944.1 helix-turn-helix domain-containing protein [Myxococcota bacterium]